MLKLSTFRSIRDTVPVQHVCSNWSEILEKIGPHRIYSAKDEAPAFSPCEFVPGANARTKTNAIEVHFGVMDLDGLPMEDVAQIVAEFPGACVVMSTWSHGDAQAAAVKKKKGLVCCRIFFPFTRSVRAAEWGQFWQAANETLMKGLADDKCKDVSHVYYMPAVPQVPSAEPLLYGKDGYPINVDVLLGNFAHIAMAEGAPLPVAGEGGQIVTEDDLRSLAKSLLRMPSKKKYGSAIFAGLKGEPMAGAGERHDVVFRVSCEIVDRYPLCDPARVAAYFERGLKAQAGSDPLEDMESMLRSKQTASRSALSIRIREAFQDGRTEPYTPEEVEEFATLQECSVEQMKRRFVLQKGKMYWLFFNGRYVRYSVDDVLAGATRDLAPAISLGIDLTKISKTGSSPKTPGELVREYGTAIQEISYSYSAMTDKYDPLARELILAPTPVRVIAQFNPKVDAWLRILSGQYYPRLVVWMASIFDLTTPAAALYLDGMRGTGKSLLAMGLSKAYSPDRPASLEEAIGGQWNEALLKSPIVFGDESAPVDWRGRPKTAELREFIQARTRPLARRYHDSATIKGSVRLILAANNKNLLASPGENLTENDIAAIAERFFYLPVEDAAREYLKRLEPGETLKWVDGDQIAAHARWFFENVPIPRDTRFIASDENDVTLVKAMLSSGLRGSICQWLSSYLLNPKKFGPFAPRYVKVREEQIYVKARIIGDLWSSVLNTKSDPPSMGAIARALGGMSSEITLREVDSRGKVITSKYRKISREVLYQWIADTGYMTEEEFMQSLHTLSQDASPVHVN